MEARPEEPFQGVIIPGVNEVSQNREPPMEGVNVLSGLACDGDPFAMEAGRTYHPH